MGRTYRLDTRRGTIIVLAFFVVLGCVWLAGNWPVLLAKLARVAYLSQTEVRSTVNLTGTLIDAQQVLVAPAEGTIQWLVPAGQRVAVGETVARITSADGGVTAVNAPAAGLLSYTTDGLETLLLPSNLPDMTMPNTSQAKSVTVTGGQAVNAGQSVGRVSDNLDPVYIYASDLTVPSGMLVAGKSWTLVWQGQDLAATVASLRGQAPNGSYFVQLNRYPDNLLASRTVSFSVVTATMSGYLVSQSALVTAGGQTGIDLVDDGRVQWTPVEVTGSLAGMADLSGLPDDAALYVVNPRWVREGVPVS